MTEFPPWVDLSTMRNPAWCWAHGRICWELSSFPLVLSKATPATRAGLSNRRPEWFPWPTPTVFLSHPWSGDSMVMNEQRAWSQTCACFKSKSTISKLSDLGWVTYLPELSVLNSKAWCHKIMTNSNSFYHYPSKDSFWWWLASGGHDHFKLNAGIVLRDISSLSAPGFPKPSGCMVIRLVAL